TTFFSNQNIFVIHVFGFCRCHIIFYKIHDIILRLFNSRKFANNLFLPPCRRNSIIYILLVYIIAPCHITKKSLATVLTSGRGSRDKASLARLRTCSRSGLHHILKSGINLLAFEFTVITYFCHIYFLLILSNNFLTWSTMSITAPTLFFYVLNLLIDLRIQSL